MGQLDEKTALVVGASRGLGRGIAEQFSVAGAAVVAVARNPTALAELVSAHPRIRTEVADATDPAVAGELLDRHQPDILALVAGARPLLRQVHHHTWETCSGTIMTDEQIMGLGAAGASLPEPFQGCMSGIPGPQYQRQGSG